MAGQRGKGAVIKPGDESAGPTPAEVYQAALAGGATPDEATAASEARAIELATDTPPITHEPLDAGDEHFAQLLHELRAWLAEGPQVQIAGVVREEVDRILDQMRQVIEGQGPARPGWPTLNEQRATDGLAPVDLAPPAAERWEPEHCPTPGMCFPYLTMAASSASCIHGTTAREQ